MSSTFVPIDISHNPDLLRLVEEVRKTRIPRALKKDNETLAVISPVASDEKHARNETDDEAFRKAAGSLKGFIDAEKLKKDIYESRKLVTRPAFKL